MCRFVYFTQGGASQQIFGGLTAGWPKNVMEIVRKNVAISGGLLIFLFDLMGAKNLP